MSVDGEVGAERRYRIFRSRAIRRLVLALTEYDQVRARLWSVGGGLADLMRIATILQRRIVVAVHGSVERMTLTDRKELRATLDRAGAFDIHLEVRQTGATWPTWYLCRLGWSFFDECGVVLEDLYRSTDFPRPDDRFVRLTDLTHETARLRLSDYRDGVRLIRGAGSPLPEAEVDKILLDVARHVLQPAWHEDQRPGLCCARHFQMPRFAEAINLLYLCLGGDLSTLRGALSEDMIRFFTVVCPHHAIRSFLHRLSSSDGRLLVEAPERARHRFRALTGAFGRFLRMLVDGGGNRRPQPLWKLLFANLERPDRLDRLGEDPGIRTTAATLEALSGDVIHDLTSGAD